MVMRASLLISVCAFVLAACARSTEGEPSGDQFTLPPGSDAASIPAKSFGAPGQSITGILGFDDIEGGCSFVEAADGTRYEVTYPEGWELDRLSGELRGPDGSVVSAGESLTIRGSVVTDRSSTCQIGPIFVAIEVQIPTR